MSLGSIRLADIRLVYRLAMEKAVNRGFAATLLKRAGRDRTRRVQVRGELLAHQEAAEAFERRPTPTRWSIFVARSKRLDELRRGRWRKVPVLRDSDVTRR
jgi:hypothetical protein